MNTHINNYKLFPRLMPARLLAGGLMAFLMAFAGFGNTAYASGSSYFILSPSGGSYTVGNTITLSVSVYGAGGDDVHAAQANLSYSTSKLQYISNSTGGSFDVGCPSHTGGGGSVTVACGASAAISGSALLASVSFKVLASGSATISMTSGSDIDSGGGSSVWDGSLKSASFTLNAAAVSGGSSSSSSAKKTTTTTTTKPTTPAPTTPTPTPTTTTPTPTTTKSSSTPYTAGSISVTVTDAHGQPVGGAKVELDNKTVEYSTVKGLVGFTNVSDGSHTVTISAPGKKATSSTLNIGAGESRQVDIKLANATSPALLFGAPFGALLLVGAGVFAYFRFFRHRGLQVNGSNVVPQQAAVVTSPPVLDPPDPAAMAGPESITSTALPRTQSVSPSPPSIPTPTPNPTPAPPSPPSTAPPVDPAPSSAPPTNTPPKLGSTT